MTPPISRAMLPWFVTACLDRGDDAGAERFAIELRDGDVLVLGADPAMPAVTCSWGDGAIEGNMELGSLPESVLTQILLRTNEAFSDFINQGLHDQARSYRDIMLDVVGYARNGKTLQLPEDFELLVLLNAESLDRFMLEEAGQLRFSELLPDADLTT